MRTSRRRRPASRLAATAALAPGRQGADFATRGAIAGKGFNLKLSDALKKGPWFSTSSPPRSRAAAMPRRQRLCRSDPRVHKAGATVIGMSADTVVRWRSSRRRSARAEFAVASAGPKVIAGYDVALPQKMQGRSITTAPATSSAVTAASCSSIATWMRASMFRRTLAAVRDSARADRAVFDHRHATLHQFRCTDIRRHRMLNERVGQRTAEESENGRRSLRSDRSLSRRPPLGADPAHYSSRTRSSPNPCRDRASGRPLSDGGIRLTPATSSISARTRRKASRLPGVTRPGHDDDDGADRLVAQTQPRSKALR